MCSKIYTGCANNRLFILRSVNLYRVLITILFLLLSGCSLLTPPFINRWKDLFSLGPGLVIFVAPNGVDENNLGTNSGYPLLRISTAIARAQELGATNIWLAKGQYNLSQGLTNGKAAIILSHPGISLRGGWDPFFQNQLGYSYIQATGFRHGLVITNSHNHLLDKLWLTGSRTDINGISTNGGGIYISGSADIVLRNCILSNNFAEGCGGGIFITSCTDITLMQVTIISNSSVSHGGGIYALNLYDSRWENLDVISNAVTGNDGQAGGCYIGDAHRNSLNINLKSNFNPYHVTAFWIQNSHHNLITGSVQLHAQILQPGVWPMFISNSHFNQFSAFSIISNTSYFETSGAWFLDCQSNTLDMTCIANINSGDSAGALKFLRCNYSDFTLTGQHNRAYTFGGLAWAINCSTNKFIIQSVLNQSYVYGGGLALSNSHYNDVTGIFISNSCEYGNGGGISIYDAHHNNLHNLILLYNTSINQSGGGIAVEGYPNNIYNTVISSNTVYNTGGALYLRFDKNSGSQTYQLTNLLIRNNSSSINGGGGLYILNQTASNINLNLSDLQCTGNSGYGFFISTNNLVWTTNRAVFSANTPADFQIY